jgi:hypothetical protein
MPATQFVDIYPDSQTPITGPAAPGLAGDISGGIAGAVANALQGALNEDYPGLPPGATPEKHDITVTIAGTYDLWIPPADRKAVITSAFLSTDTAGRIAIVDDTDSAGRRIAVHYAGVNGGASPNLVPAPAELNSPGGHVRVVVAQNGNTFIRVSGYLKP